MGDDQKPVDDDSADEQPVGMDDDADDDEPTKDEAVKKADKKAGCEFC